MGHPSILRVLDDRHSLAGCIKRKVLRGVVMLLRFEPGFVRCDNHRVFGRFAWSLPSVVVFLYCGMIAVQAGLQQRDQVVTLPVVSFFTGCFKFKVASRVVADACDLN
tara:strand:+ start:594 stop:917 length:324 start_codon:yes stop_codon:yes gene_type:complete